jgi:hypothetical protein
MDDNQYNQPYQMRQVPGQRIPGREPEKIVRKPRMRILPLFIFVLFLFMTGVAIYEWYQLRNLRAQFGLTETEDVKGLVDQVGKLVVLPENETPTVATVADPAALKDQPFFAKAKKGDKVLIFTKAQRAILYDPVAHKIVEISPINISNNTPIPSTSTKPKP